VSRRSSMDGARGRGGTKVSDLDDLVTRHGLLLPCKAMVRLACAATTPIAWKQQPDDLQRCSRAGVLPASIHLRIGLSLPPNAHAAEPTRRR
jgi:hypothetical protein